MSVFMFTDIEDSTHLWEQCPDVMAQALAYHDAILQDRIKAQGGKVIKHLGDGLFAVFEAGKPLTCALEIQKQLDRQNWEAIGTLRVRIALHAGQAYRRDGDYFGPVVNRTSRLLDIGWGGQILLTPEVLNIADLPPQSNLRDLGVHRLKGLTAPQKIYWLIPPDLREPAFSDLPSISACWPPCWFSNYSLLSAHLLAGYVPKAKTTSFLELFCSNFGLWLRHNPVYHESLTVSDKF